MAVGMQQRIKTILVTVMPKFWKLGNIMNGVGSFVNFIQGGVAIDSARTREVFALRNTVIVAKDAVPVC
jgi:hypothetical protein